MFGLVASGLDLTCALLNENPGQVATRQVVALGTRFSTLAFGTAHELLEFPVQLLDVPAHGVFCFHVVRGQTRRRFVLTRVGVIGDEPLNVAVWGDNLEQTHRKGQLLELDQQAFFQSLRCPLDPLVNEGKHFWCFWRCLSRHLPNGCF